MERGFLWPSTPDPSTNNESSGLSEGIEIDTKREVNFDVPEASFPRESHRNKMLSVEFSRKRHIVPE